MHHPPKLEYRGLTIILAHPSRFDSKELLSGNAGAWFSGEAMRPGMNRFQCDIWTLESFNKTGRKLLEGTKVVLLLGKEASKDCFPNNTLGEVRGSPIVKDGIVYMSSYFPQDVNDFKDFEGEYWKHAEVEPSEMDDVYEEEEEDTGEKSRHGKTKRGNWKFWLERDVKKAIKIAKEGMPTVVEPEYRIYPRAEEVIESLHSYENTDFHLDIETDSALNITCFGFGFGRTSPIWIVPLIRYDYTLAYSRMGGIMRGLANALDRNTTVAHNGSGFDFIVIPLRYRIPLGKSMYDSMIAHQRCFPEVEKSLGHGISNFTYLPFHKDEGIFEPHNEDQEYSLWKYNGKDVFGMRELKYAIDDYANTIPGLTASIQRANRAIRPYLTTTLFGIRYRVDRMMATIEENDEYMMQYLRMLRIAMGERAYKEVQGKSKSGMPGSSTQCVKYFHDLLDYPVVARSAKTRKPKLDEKALLKLKLKYNNPVIDIVLNYRGKSKESGSLTFNPWNGIGQPLVIEKPVEEIKQITEGVLTL